MLYSSLHCNMTHEICKSDLNPHLEVVWNGSSAGFLLIPVSLSSVTHNDGVLEKYNTRTDTEIHRRLPNPDARYSFHYNSVYEDIFGHVNVTFCVEMRPNSKFTCVLRRALGKCDTLGGFYSSSRHTSSFSSGCCLVDSLGSRLEDPRSLIERRCTSAFQHDERVDIQPVLAPNASKTAALRFKVWRFR